MTKVAIFEFEGHAAILKVTGNINIIEHSKKIIPGGFDFWVVDSIQVEHNIIDGASVEPQLIDFGVNAGTTPPSGTGEGAPID